MNDQPKAELVAHEATEAAEPVSQTAAVISMIERASRDQAVDLDKFERLVSMKERIEAEDARKQYAVAMSAAQSEMEPIRSDLANTQTKSRYASLAALDRAIRPIYTKHGFVLTFDSGSGAPELNVRVLCDVMHSAGHVSQRHLDVPADGKGAKGGDVMTKTHATISAISYGQRILTKMVWNLTEFDDDGNSAGNKPITNEQLTTLRTVIDEIEADIPKFCNYLNVPSLAEIPANQYDKAMSALEARRAKK